ncbi:hypothetical protein ACF07Q_28715 [Nocardiopsis dassonvillei]|uniref:hypothetical protein n=1 Tax=Nocardiopsis dassonvillei TaxID=2014 RepID=UPI0036FFB39C
MSAPAWLDQVPEDHGPLRYHTDVAAAARAHPRRWRLVGEYVYRGRARDVAALIRRGGSPAWEERTGGRYEPRFFTTDAGAHVVYVRWIPTPKQTGASR